MDAIGVAIVEDEASVRESLGLIVDSTEGLRCTGLYPDGESALRGVAEAPPDVVLLDIGLPGIPGTKVARRLHKLLPSVQIVMLTVFEDEDLIFESLRAGAVGYLLKRTPPGELLRAIREVARGGSPMSGRIARRVVQAFHETPQATEPLTPREREVLDLLAEGRRYREISERLGISVETVRTHVRHIYEKLHVHSRTEAVMKSFGIPRKNPPSV